MMRKPIVFVWHLFLLLVVRPFFLLVMRSDTSMLKSTTFSKSIVASNHPARLDPFFVMFGLPLRVSLGMLPIGFMTANHYYYNACKPLMWASGCFPARRSRDSQSGSDFGIGAANKLLAGGYSVQVFPEGRLSRDYVQREAYKGVVDIHQENPDTPLMLCFVRHNWTLGNILRGNAATTRFALATDVRYTDANKLMDEVYALGK